MRRHLAITAAAAAAALIAGCSGPGPTAAGNSPPPPRLRLGLVADITQAPALLAVRDRLFHPASDRDVIVQPIAFRTGTAELAALEAGKLDAAYASTDTILAVCQAKGASFIKIISGAASGGGELVVNRSITTIARLKGATIAVPAIGGPQDIALRYWLRTQHLIAATASGGDVHIVARTPGQATLAGFDSGTISGAWATPPDDVEMISNGGHALATEASLAPGLPLATTSLIVTQKFLSAHTSSVIGLIKDQILANNMLHQNPIKTLPVIDAELKTLTGTSLEPTVLAASFAQLTFTDDPGIGSMTIQAQHASAVGLPTPASNLASLYDIALLDFVLRTTGQPLARP